MELLQDANLEVSLEGEIGESGVGAQASKEGTIYEIRQARGDKVCTTKRGKDRMRSFLSWHLPSTKFVSPPHHSHDREEIA